MPRKQTRVRQAPKSASVVDPLEAERTAALKEFDEKQAALNAKQAELNKEAKALEELRRGQIRQFITSFTLVKDELDAFVTVLDALPGKQQLTDRLLKCEVKDKDSFITKLVRMGLL